MDVAPTAQHVGLQAVFKEMFPIHGFDGNYILDFVKYKSPSHNPRWRA